MTQNERNLQEENSCPLPCLLFKWHAAQLNLIAGPQPPGAAAACRYFDESAKPVDRQGLLNKAPKILGALKSLPMAGDVDKWRPA
jgi:hypothetical protein